jgi:dihydroorotase
MDPYSEVYGERKDVLILRGRIEEMADSLNSSKGRKVIEGDDLRLSPGWIDLKAHFCDPGEEFKEDLDTGLRASTRGGFTGVVSSSSTYPPVDNKGSLKYLKERAKGHKTRLYPSACISKGRQGESLAELTDLSRSGAILMSDAPDSIRDSGLMLKALLYAKNSGTRISNVPADGEVSPHGVMNEGGMSSLLGMVGSPHLTETLALQRDIALLDYTKSKLHVSGLSTSEGVQLVKAAKRKGLDITAEVHLANLLWTDAKLDGFDTRFKLSPPLRNEKDRKALIKGVKDGTIDAISSDHRPEDIEHKKIEFGRAAFGLALAESFFPLYQEHLADELPLDDFLRAVTDGPCHVLGFTPARLKVGARAIFTCFDPSQSPDSNVMTKAYNHLVGQLPMTGKVIDISSGPLD